MEEKQSTDNPSLKLVGYKNPEQLDQTPNRNGWSGVIPEPWCMCCGEWNWHIAECESVILCLTCGTVVTLPPKVRIPAPIVSCQG